MKNRVSFIMKGLTAGMGLLLLTSYLFGNIEIGRANDRLEYVNLISQSDKEGVNYALAENIQMQNQRLKEPLRFVNWRQDSGGQVVYEELNRAETTEIMCVYGRTDLLFPSCNILDVGSLTSCLISEELAFKLFGGTDVVGNKVEYQDYEYEIVDVIDSNIPLFVYELRKNDTTTVLNRATVSCIQNSPEKTKSEYDKMAGMWELVDYHMLFYIVRAAYFFVPWILGIGCLISVRKYKKAAHKIVKKKKGERKFCSSIQCYWKYNKAWMIWDIVFGIFMLGMIIFTLIQIEIPQDMIPDQWSDFEFWVQYYESKRKNILVLVTIKKGIVDFFYMVHLYKSAIMLVLCVIEVSIFTHLVRKYIL